MVCEDRLGLAIFSKVDGVKFVIDCGGDVDGDVRIGWRRHFSICGVELGLGYEWFDGWGYIRGEGWW